MRILVKNNKNSNFKILKGEKINLNLTVGFFVFVFFSIFVMLQKMLSTKKQI